MNDTYFDLQSKFPRLQTQKILGPLTTFHIGGPADLYYELNESAELPALIEAAREKKLPYLILGGGSNIIFADEGFRGLIIHLKNKKIEVQNDMIIADAGALLSQVVQASLKNNLSGMEKMMGLPGTIGGAVRGNAGAFGLETKDLVAKAEIYNEENGLHTVDKSYFHFGYRESVIKHNKDIVLKIYLKLTPAEPINAQTLPNNDYPKKTQPTVTKALQETLDILKSRAGSQPTGKCSGSFFKNPHRSEVEKNTSLLNDTIASDAPKTAGYFLDQAGCKGLRVGDAQVSEKHANWIMNLGQATQQNVIELSTLMQQKVKEKFGIVLEREVQLVGPKGFLVFEKV